MRELMRSIARENMKKAGYEHLNKKRPRTKLNPTGKSIFSAHWREYVHFGPKRRKRRVVAAQ